MSCKNCNKKIKAPRPSDAYFAAFAQEIINELTSDEIRRFILIIEEMQDDLEMTRSLRDCFIKIVQSEEDDLK